MVFARRLALAALAAAAACASAPDDDDIASPACVEDEAALMALDYDAFDQDLTPGGWRAVAETPGCRRAAAALIAAWRDARDGTLPPDQMQILWWHEGQVLAADGDYAAAIPRLETARTFHDDGVPPPDAPAEDVEMWRANILVRDAWEDATLAFLRRDRAGLEDARARMLAVPEPPGFMQLQDLFEAKTGARMAWPLNIEGVERMAACFDEVYGVECRDEAAR